MRRNKEHADIIEKKVFKVLKFIGFGILGLCLAILFGFVVKWLWNALLPDIFGLTEITYWQGVGIFVLGKILFGGFGGNNSNNKSSKGSIRHEVGSAMKEDFHKGFRDGYYGKDCEEMEIESDHSSEGNARVDNELDDELYEKWWSKEGEKRFEAFIKEKDVNSNNPS